MARTKKPSQIVMVRFAPEQKLALERAAKDEVIPPSTLARKLVVEWLREHGYLPPKSK